MGSSTLLVPVREVANNAVHVLRGRHEVHRLELWLGMDSFTACMPSVAWEDIMAWRGDMNTVRASEQL